MHQNSSSLPIAALSQIQLFIANMHPKSSLLPTPANMHQNSSSLPTCTTIAPLRTHACTHQDNYCLHAPKCLVTAHTHQNTCCLSTPSNMHHNNHHMACTKIALNCTHAPQQFFTAKLHKNSYSLPIPACMPQTSSGRCTAVCAVHCWEQVQQDHSDVVSDMYHDSQASLLKPCQASLHATDICHLKLDIQIFLLVVWAEPVCQQEHSACRLSS